MSNKVGIYSNIPTFGTVGRFFYASDLETLYYDTGTAWLLYRAGVKYRGAWTTGLIYFPGDIVTVSSQWFLCTVSLVSSTTPGSDTTHWQLMSWYPSLGTVFAGHLSAGYTPSSGFNILAINTVDRDDGTASGGTALYSTSTHKYSAPSAGLYQMICQVRQNDGGTQGQQMGMILGTNTGDTAGNSTWAAYPGTSNSRLSVSNTAAFPLTAGATCQPSIYCDTLSLQIVGAFLTIYRIA